MLAGHWQKLIQYRPHSGRCKCRSSQFVQPAIKSSRTHSIILLSSIRAQFRARGRLSKNPMEHLYLTLKARVCVWAVGFGLLRALWLLGLVYPIYNLRHLRQSDYHRQVHSIFMSIQSFYFGPAIAYILANIYMASLGTVGMIIACLFIHRSYYLTGCLMGMYHRLQPKHSQEPPPRRVGCSLYGHSQL